MNYTLDTNILSYILKGNQKIYKKVKKKIEEGNEFYINPISYYEIKRGLLAINSKNKLKMFNEYCNNIFIYLDLDKAVLNKAVEIYVDLRNKGELIEDADIFIGAVCLENDLVLITNNEKHFNRIDKLSIVNWV
ncbi:MAG: type II toxin-antitoxin system VapC family toxin [bacterium]